MLNEVSTDVRFAWRSLRRSPRFAVFAVLILAVGIGSTSSLFSVLDQVVIRPFQFRDPERLVVIHEVLPSSITPQSPVSASHFEEWVARTRSFEHMALLAPVIYTLGTESTPELVDASRVSASLFKTLGAPVALGRTFSAEEELIGRHYVVVLSHDFWTRRFAANPGIVGQPIRLDGDLYTVIGVLGAGFEMSNVSALYPMAVSPVRPQLWTPLGLHASERLQGHGFNFACVARLAPHVSIDHATGELNTVQEEIGRTILGRVALRASVVPLHTQLTAPFRRGVWLLLLAAVVVLLVACVNISGLWLARATTRQQEFGIRHALGATRGRLLRQLAAESAIVALGGGLLAIALTPAMIRQIASAAPIAMPRLDHVSLDGRVLLFAVASVFLCALVVGGLPAWRSSTSTSNTLRSSGKGVGDSPNRRLHMFLLATEAAASTACVIVAGLLTASMMHVLGIDSGFHRERIVAGELRMPVERYSVTRAANLLRDLRDAMRAIPGVTAVGISDRVLLKGEGGNLPIAPEGSTLSRLERPMASLQLADGAYFDALGIPVIEGRVFQEVDRERPPIAIVARAAGQRIWPGERIIGKRFRIGGDTSVPFEVVGVVEDVRGVSLETSPRPSIYLPYWHAVIGQASLSIRTTADSAVVVPLLQSAIRRLDPEMAVPRFETIDEIVANSTRGRRFQTNLALMSAICTLLLTALGIYSALNHISRRMAREMAIRIALGAKAGHIRRMVLRQALIPVAIGIGAGVAMALTLTRLLRGLTFGVSPQDPRFFALTAIVIGIVALLAGLGPALRASRQDPLVAMRSE